MGPWPKFVIERVDFWRKSINCRCRTPCWRCYQGPKTSSKSFHKDAMSEKEILDPLPKDPCGLTSKELQQIKLCTLCNSLLSQGLKDTAGRGSAFGFWGRWICLLQISKSSRVATGDVQSRCNKAARRKVQPTNNKKHTMSQYVQIERERETEIDVDIQIETRSIKSLAKDSSIQVYTFQLHLYHHHTTRYPFHFYTHKKTTTFDSSRSSGPETYPIEPRSSPLKLNQLHCHFNVSGGVITEEKKKAGLVVSRFSNQPIIFMK